AQLAVQERDDRLPGVRPRIHPRRGQLHPCRHPPRHLGHLRPHRRPPRPRRRGLRRARIRLHARRALPTPPPPHLPPPLRRGHQPLERPPLRLVRWPRPTPRHRPHLRLRLRQPRLIQPAPEQQHHRIPSLRIHHHRTRPAVQHRDLQPQLLGRH